MTTGVRKNCMLDTGLHQKCLSNCKTVVSDNRWQTRLVDSCIAPEKLRQFQLGKNSFGVAQSAFLQCEPGLMESFINEAPEHIELIRYFLGAQRPDESGSIAANLKPKTLYNIFKVDFQHFEKLKRTRADLAMRGNYFLQKTTAYWARLPVNQICQLIAYIVRSEKDIATAAQFIVLVPPSVISKFPELSGLSESEERELFIGLGGDLYSLPLLSPGIYDHMLTLFADDPETSMILGGMEELVKRRNTVITITGSMIDYYNKNNARLSLPALYSELFGIEVELAAEVLNQLLDDNVISAGERETLLEILKSGKIDYIRQAREDLLSDP
ncbi:MAG: hypothetical protein K8S54_00735 [Spirochaetia bacterium]|nr:hypothetical protein [Spirochaetia bacterium]